MRDHGAPTDERAEDTADASTKRSAEGPGEAVTVKEPGTRRPSSASARVFPAPAWDRYEQISFLGAGGMGNVWKARDPRLGRSVALKLIRGSDPELVRKLLREARAQARIEHDHICKVYEVGEVAGHPYIAMQFIEGRSLKEAKRAMTLSQKVAAVRDVAEALHAAHRVGLVHRDIKPANVMMELLEEGGFHPYVMDFGIAREVDRPGQTMTGVVEGTPSYMAPEQAMGDVQRIDRRTDVYSLGATLYELFAGRPPFVGDTSVDILIALTREEPMPLRKIDPGIPVDLETIAMKCLEKEPARRYDSAKALADDLRRYMEGEPIAARPATLGYLALKKARKHKLVVAVSAAALASVLVLGGAGVSARLAAREQARLAQRLGQDVKEMEHFLRYAYAMPLHDVGREKAVIRARMERLSAEAAEVRGVGEGPLEYALGRGHMALHEHDKALERLTRAWAAGYRTPEVELAMGLAMGELYKRGVDEAQRIPDAEAREARRKELHERYLAPALKHMAASSQAEVESRRYVEALVAFYSKDHGAALAKAREAFAEAPWLYEAKKLEGDILHADGSEKQERGDYKSALRDYNEAAFAYQVAAEGARSDASVHVSIADLWLNVLEIDGVLGTNPRASFDKVIAAFDQALIADPKARHAYSKKVLAYFRLASTEINSGAAPSLPLERGLEAGQQAIQANPEDAAAHDYIGNIYLLKSYGETRDGRDPSRSFENAINHYTEAIRIDPNFAWAWNDLGTAACLQGEWSARHGRDPEDTTRKAIESYKRAVAIKPTYLYAHSNLCDSYWRKGRYEFHRGSEPDVSWDRAVEACNAALRLNPNHPLGYGNLSLIHLAKIEYAIATGSDARAALAASRSALARAVELSPNQVEWTQSLVTLHWLESLNALSAKESARDILADAGVTIRQLLKLAPADASTHLLKSRIELVTARAAIATGEDPAPHFTAAQASLEKATRLRSTDAEIHHAAAELSRRMAEWHLDRRRADDALKAAAEGLASIEKSLAINPGLPAAIATSGALHLLRARAARKPSDRADAARLAQTSIENALKANQFLKREYEPLLAEATAIAEATPASATVPASAPASASVPASASAPEPR